MYFSGEFINNIPKNEFTIVINNNKYIGKINNNFYPINGIL